MPIRSDHGRNATLRSLATWPLYSPRRLLGTITAIVTVCAAITIAASTGTTPTAAPSAPAPTPTWSVSLGTPLTSSSASTPLTVSVIVGDPLATARRFADTWIRRAEPQAWRDQLAPLCTDEFRAVILPTLTPGPAAITGSPTLTRAHAGVAEVTVPLDTAVLALTLQDVTGGGDWRVSNAQPWR